MKLKLFNLIFLSAITLGSTPARLFAQSPDKPAMTPVTVGRLAPDFALEDEKGNNVRLTDQLEQNVVVLVFYRGYW